MDAPQVNSKLVARVVDVAIAAVFLYIVIDQALTGRLTRWIVEQRDRTLYRMRQQAGEAVPSHSMVSAMLADAESIKHASAKKPCGCKDRIPGIDDVADAIDAERAE